MAFNDQTAEASPAEVASIAIDIELRDLWEKIDEMCTGSDWDDDDVSVAASLMRVAFAKGRELGMSDGRRKGFDEGYEAALTEHA